MVKYVKVTTHNGNECVVDDPKATVESLALEEKIRRASFARRGEGSVGCYIKEILKTDGTKDTVATDKLDSLCEVVESLPWEK